MSTATYELRLYADPAAFPFGLDTISRHRTYQAARRAWRYAERHARAPLPRVIVVCWPDGREYIGDDTYAVLERTC
ncbi:MAG: hypothetical protein EBY24_21690 [Betaproteobacteria bacterium]|nr:hypothetical protein [Betaproteobacteria bacterium]